MSRRDSIWRRRLFALAGRLPAKVIHAEKPDAPGPQPLFERYRLLSLPGGAGIFLHHYLRSDPDRGLHDHPWPWALAVPLAGGYVEERARGFGLAGIRTERKRRRPFVPYRITDRDLHRLHLDPGATSWSLFVHGPYARGWGFMRREPETVENDKNPILSPAFRYHQFDPPPPDKSGDDWRIRPKGREIERAAP